nr:cell wall-binding repeat-containing protein [Ornithinimicrobium sp. F0845]
MANHVNPDGTLTDYITETHPWVNRVTGVDRYGTAAQLASEYFQPGGTVYVASGSVFPDALAAGALAGQQQAPVLLTAAERLPLDTREALEALAPSEIVLLGGSVAVSDEVAAELAAYGEVTRIAGPDRWGTSALIAEEFGTAETVFVAVGTEYADALAAVPAAGTADAPVILTHGDHLSQAAAGAIERLGATQFVVVGGEGAVSSAVETELEQLGTVTRVSGLDRYATAEQLARTYFEGPVANALVTSGQNYPDALAAGPVGVIGQRPVLLTRADGVPVVVRDVVRDLQIRSLTISGGENAVSTGVEQSLADIVLTP